jgi:hypothetical protein
MLTSNGGLTMVFLTKHVLLIMILMLVSITAAQGPADGENEYRLAAVNRVISGMDSISSDAGRGVYVVDNPDLDNDGKPEIIVTEYTKGGRVFVFEVVDNDKIEYVWSSKKLSSGAGGGSTPRTVTVGDFDNNGKQEIIFPVGYFATDSAEFAMRGLYFYEWTGNDDDYGSEPTYKLSYESIDPAFASVNAGRTESGLRCQDIDGDGRNELIFPPRAFDFSVAKLYIMQVTSGLLSDSTAVIENEYVYTDMVQVPDIKPDGYVPVGTDIGDVDGDGFDEIIVAAWQNIGAGAAVGFIQIDGEDAYTPGGIVRVAAFSAFQVKANPLFATVNDEPVIYLHGSTGTSGTTWVMEGIVSDQFVSDANLYELFTGVGFWSAWDLGDQDHPTDSDGDGLDLYLYGGSGRILDIEYKGSGSVTDPNSYTRTEVYNLANEYDNLDGLFNDIFTYPGMDLDRDGKRDFIASYKGSELDTLSGQSMAFNGFHAYMFEWGDSLSSTDLDSTLTGFEFKTLTLITPNDYQLEQNYPNPFNPTTTIDFTLPVNKKISLKIFNMLGQEVRTLANQEAFASGTHSVTWDGTDNGGNAVASGTYIYKLFYGSFSQSKRMTLVR